MELPLSGGPAGGQLLRVQHPLVGLFRQHPDAAGDLRLGGLIQLPQAPGIAFALLHPGVMPRLSA